MTRVLQATNVFRMSTRRAKTLSMDTETVRRLANDLDLIQNEDRLDNEKTRLAAIIEDEKVKHAEFDYFAVPDANYVKYFIFLQRLFHLKDVDEAAQFYRVLGPAEQKELYKIMLDFIEPVTLAARERIIHWVYRSVNEIAAEVLTRDDEIVTSYANFMDRTTEVANFDKENYLDSEILVGEHDVREVSNELFCKY